VGRLFEPEITEVTGGRRHLHNEEFRRLNASPIKNDEMRKEQMKRDTFKMLLCKYLGLKEWK
jgi:hypothetical protein